MRAFAVTFVRLIAVAASLGLTTGCGLLLGMPDLSKPDNVATMEARFKTTIKAQDGNQSPLDWGDRDQRIWWHAMGPTGVEYCGRPANMPVTQRTYQVNFYRGSFGRIDQVEVNTPLHPAESSVLYHCGPRPHLFHGAVEPIAAP